MFVGWVLRHDAVEEYETGTGPLARRSGSAWLFAVDVISPAFLAFTLLTGVVEYVAGRRTGG